MGICVAFPVFYATAKPNTNVCCSAGKWRGFLWALFSGLSEPIGAAIGYLVLLNVLSDIAYGVVFGLVGGMMIYIVVKELLPTAHEYDPKDYVATLGFFCGMLVMASSLVTFAARKIWSVVVLCALAIVMCVAIAFIVFAIAFATNTEARRNKIKALLRVTKKEHELPDLGGSEQLSQTITVTAAESAENAVASNEEKSKGDAVRVEVIGLEEKNEKSVDEGEGEEVKGAEGEEKKEDPAVVNRSVDSKRED